MKKILVIAVLLSAATAFAGTYTITTTAAQDTRLERQRVRLNRSTCAQSGSLPANCTQAQARIANPAAKIFTSIADLIDRGVVQDYVVTLKQADTSDDAAQAAAAWVAMNDTQKNAVCSLLGLPAGCEAWTR
jgi:hypothetical protein